MTLAKKRRLATLLLIGLMMPTLALYAGPGPAQAQGVSTVSRTFAQTGKTVSGKFLEYWLIHGELAQQGYPISNELSEVSDTDGKAYTVQYFERAVFEYHPEKAAPNDILLSLLGSFLYGQKYKGAGGVSGQEPNTSAGSVVFTETGKRLGGKFLQYWRNNGGLAQQGLPISDEFMEKSDLDGKTYRVQYFERAVFELHTELHAPNDVLLSQLGTFRYKGKYEGAGAVQPRPATAAVPSAGWETAQVTRVVDGDTIHVMLNGQDTTVRYILVNTPETVDPRSPVECYGKEASSANKAMVEGKKVYLAKDVSNTDQFGRILRYVFTQDGFVNAELVKGGYAQVSTYPPDVKHETYLRDLERQAREGKVGLWAPTTCNGVLAPAQPTPKPPAAATPTRQSAPTQKPAPTKQPTAVPPVPPTGTGKVVISGIYYDGQETRSEGDEYITIKNVGTSSVNLEGYSINAGDNGQDFTFPSFVLRAGAAVRVYTNRDIAGSFSFGRGSAIWNNQGDCGYLYNPEGTQVSEYCY